MKLEKVDATDWVWVSEELTHSVAVCSSVKGANGRAEKYEKFSRAQHTACQHRAPPLKKWNVLLAAVLHNFHLFQKMMECNTDLPSNE